MILKNEILKAYRDGRLILLLGAGASYDSLSKNGERVPQAEDMARQMANEMSWDYDDEPLSTVYSAYKQADAARLENYFERRLTETNPSKALLKIAKLPWSRIYTLNIDDCLEQALTRSGIQKFKVFGRNDPLRETDPIFNNLQVIKLNGDAKRVQDGFIFSPEEYGQSSARIPLWYGQLAQDYSNYTFVFIGTKLNEPLFQHVMAQMRSIQTRSPQLAYAITPTASPIERIHLQSIKIEHISGTIEDFSDWIDGKLGGSVTPWDLAVGRRPELGKIGKNRKLNEQQMRAFNSVIAVSPENLPKTHFAGKEGSIREFYKGYKPNWKDILDEVPAELNATKSFVSNIEQKSKSKGCVALIGPAGSGKTTLLMQAALTLSRSTETPIYYLREPVSDFMEVVHALEGVNSGTFYLFIDKADIMRDQIAQVLTSKEFYNIRLVISESKSIWNRRLKIALHTNVSHIEEINFISQTDATAILTKLEAFGPWTRLQKMNPKDRLREVFQKSGQQLLIGLMEATTGLGFTQIIRNDYANSGNKEHKDFLILVGLAGIHKVTISSSVVGRALTYLGSISDVNRLSSDVEGIVVSNNGRLSSRHPVYVRKLFEQIVSTEAIEECLIALLKAFSDYEAPVVRSLGKQDGIVFKSIINHRFVKDMLRGDEAKILNVYSTFETIFHTDGLYWLQYGLTLRGFGEHADALDKLKTAREAFNSPHIEHAYAQQLMIIASKKTTWVDAEPLVLEAVSVFEKATELGWDRDYYPLVSSVEGHISVVIELLGVTEAQVIAKSYTNKLLAAKKDTADPRLEKTLLSVMTLATTGEWSKQPVVFESEYE
ncbi:MAG: SIR2 family protein [Sulfitobacter litoralis]|uniref:SIR2 family NAD-dependent protein deacylase n=1 Tax=Sulfitobacter litoralis TaxID=335975 RepID=UPI003000FBC9